MKKLLHPDVLPPEDVAPTGVLLTTAHKDGFPKDAAYDACRAVLGLSCFEAMMHSQIPFYKIMECAALVLFEQGGGNVEPVHAQNLQIAMRFTRVHIDTRGQSNTRQGHSGG